MKMTSITIGLDCYPGLYSRNLLPEVIHGMGFEYTDFELITRGHGSLSIWRLTNPEKIPLYLKYQEVIGERIRILCHLGRIRYGDW